MIIRILVPATLGQPEGTSRRSVHVGSQVNPCMMFDGNARQAMEFYRQVFGGELELGTVADFGSPDAPDADKIMHSRLDTPVSYVDGLGLPW